MTKKNGFTLLELLVVIGIIGILVSLITVSFSNAQQSGRDSRRRQDLVQIQNAMEQYYAQNNFTYPSCNCADTTASCCNAISTYFSGAGGAPIDPLSTSFYTYSFGTAGVDYSVTATLEKCPSGSTPPCTISVTNLQ